jgi:hypothetical protein
MVGNLKNGFVNFLAIQARGLVMSCLLCHIMPSFQGITPLDQKEKEKEKKRKEKPEPI